MTLTRKLANVENGSTKSKDWTKVTGMKMLLLSDQEYTKNPILNLFNEKGTVIALIIQVV